MFVRYIIHYMGYFPTVTRTNLRAISSNLQACSLLSSWTFFTVGLSLNAQKNSCFLQFDDLHDLLFHLNCIKGELILYSLSKQPQIKRTCSFLLNRISTCSETNFERYFESQIINVGRALTAKLDSQKFNYFVKRSS